MRLNRLLRTAVFQFSALYAVVFGTSVLILSAIVYWIAQVAGSIAAAAVLYAVASGLAGFDTEPWPTWRFPQSTMCRFPFYGCACDQRKSQRHCGKNR